MLKNAKCETITHTEFPQTKVNEVANEEVSTTLWVTNKTVNTINVNKKLRVTVLLTHRRVLVKINDNIPMPGIEPGPT